MPASVRRRPEEHHRVEQTGESKHRQEYRHDQRTGDEQRVPDDGGALARGLGQSDQRRQPSRRRLTRVRRHHEIAHEFLNIRTDIIRTVRAHAHRASRRRRRHRPHRRRHLSKRRSRRPSRAHARAFDARARRHRLRTDHPSISSSSTAGSSSFRVAFARECPARVPRIRRLEARKISNLSPFVRTF